MFKNKLNYKLLNILILVVIIAIGFETFPIWGGILNTIFNILLPFAISFAIAYSLYPCVRKLQEKGVRKSIATLMVVVAVLCIIVVLFSITIPLVYEQLISLSKTIGDVFTDVSSKFEINLGSFQDTINSSLNKIIADLGSYVSNELENYLLGLVIFMLIQLFEYSLLFFIVGHPNWLLLGILASLTTVVPYFGGLVTNIIAVILASVISPKLFIATMIICLVFPNIDGYIISPKVYGKTNDINPIWSIFAVFAGGALYGFLGIVIALPLYIVLKCTYKFFKKDIYGKIDDVL